MADPVPDDGKKWLGIPDRIWNLIFLSIATAVLTFFQSQHAATQATKQEEIKTAVVEAKEAVNEKAADLKVAVEAVPPAVAIEAAKVVEEKQAESKSAPEGL